MSGGAAGAPGLPGPFGDCALCRSESSRSAGNSPRREAVRQRSRRNVAAARQRSPYIATRAGKGGARALVRARRGPARRRARRAQAGSASCGTRTRARCKGRWVRHKRGSERTHVLTRTDGLAPPFRGQAVVPVACGVGRRVPHAPLFRASPRGSRCPLPRPPPPPTSLSSSASPARRENLAPPHNQQPSPRCALTSLRAPVPPLSRAS